MNQGDRELSVYLWPDPTSLTIPSEFLQPGTKTGGEMLAHEQSGNQTISEIRSSKPDEASPRPPTLAVSLRVTGYCLSGASAVLPSANRGSRWRAAREASLDLTIYRL